MRLVPNTRENAVYDTIAYYKNNISGGAELECGRWGRMRYTDLSGVTASTQEVTGKETGGWGVLRDEEGAFPAGNTWGSPTRRHPHEKNVMVEYFRLGNNLDGHPIEIPKAYEKYIIFYTMYKALERPGHGQNIEMAQHYEQRFAMGIDRMTKRVDRMSQERIGRFGDSGIPGPEFQLGDPKAPYPYGIPYD